MLLVDVVVIVVGGVVVVIVVVAAVAVVDVAIAVVGAVAVNWTGGRRSRSQAPCRLLLPHHMSINKSVVTDQYQGQQQ